MAGGGERGVNNSPEILIRNRPVKLESGGNVAYPAPPAHCPQPGRADGFPVKKARLRSPKAGTNPFSLSESKEFWRP